VTGAALPSGLALGVTDNPCKEDKTMSKTPQLTPGDLMQFTGTENWYRHPMNRKVLYTDGVKFLAERAGAYWLIDEIALIQPYEKAVAAEEFQLWRLIVNGNQAVLNCEDGNGRVVYSKAIAYTDFPIAEMVLYFTNGVILLPSEY
jgi:hypothetical protein